MYANYFKQGSRHILIISADTRPVGKEYQVAGKREARKLAKELNATPWNF